MKALEEEGFGRLVTREEMQKDSKRGFATAISAFFKPSPMSLNISFINRLKDPDLNETFYAAQFRKGTVDSKMFEMVKRYHPNVEDLSSSQCGTFDEGTILFKFFS